METITFIGAGPSTLAAVVKLLDNNYQGKIYIIEKGKKLGERLPNEILNGVGGAGTYSDSKLSSGLDVGGYIPNLTQEKLNEYENQILDFFNRFKSDNEELKWDETTDFNILPSNLKWDKHKTLHIGTDRGQLTYKNIQDYILSHPNVELFTECEVEDINYLPAQLQYQIFFHYYSIKNEIHCLYSNKVVIATGQKNNLPGKLIEKFNLDTIPRAFQLGIRVVDEINPQYEEIIKANYDFKFVQEKNWGNNIKTRVRTFCCNSGNAHVCEEKNSEGFSCFNGHAYKKPDPNNHSVNYGIICELEGYGNLNSKEKQIQLMKEINNKILWQLDNFNGTKVEPRRRLLDGFDHLLGYYPFHVIAALEEFVKELSKIVDLSKAKYLYPEIKLNDGKMVKTNNWETSQPNLYFIGDCASTRGITKSIISGWELADNILKE